MQRNKYVILFLVFFMIICFVSNSKARLVRDSYVIPRSLLDVYEKQAAIGRNMAEQYSDEWRQHRENSERLIEECAGVVVDKKKVSIWGGADSLRYLAENFESVSVLGLDYIGLEIVKQELPQELQSKVNIKQEDITGVIAAFIYNVQTIIKESKTSAEAADRIIDLVDGFDMPDWQISEEQKSDYIVCSLVLSQLMNNELDYIEELLVDKFTMEDVVFSFSTQRWQEAKSSFRSKVIESVIDRLKESVKTGGKIYLADTTVKNFVRLNQEGHLEIYKSEDKFSESHLADMIEDYFSINIEENWTWYMFPPEEMGDRGISFDVKALILEVP